MKDNLDIEQLFKEGLGNLEGEVRPEVWGNIQSGMAANAATSGGMGLLAKVALIGGIGAASVVTTVMLWPADETTITENVVSPEEINDENEISTDQDQLEESYREEGTVENTVDYETVTGEESEDQEVTNEEGGSNSNTQTEGITSSSTENTGPQGEQTSSSAGSESTDQGSSTNGDSETNGSDRSGTGTTSNGSPGDEIETNPTTNEVRDPLPLASLDLIYAQSPDDLKTYTFNANAENAETIRWDFGDGVTSEGENTVKHTYGVPGEYKVKLSVTGKNGEELLEVITVEVASIAKIDPLPNIISPNGDNKNDFFAINSEEIETFRITITDLRGQLVFKDNDPNFRWDGTDLQGVPVPKGDYIYVIFAEGTDGAKFKPTGTIKIIRN